MGEPGIQVNCLLPWCEPLAWEPEECQLLGALGTRREGGRLFKGWCW